MYETYAYVWHTDYAHGRTTMHSRCTRKCVYGTVESGGDMTTPPLDLELPPSEVEPQNQNQTAKDSW